MKKYNTFSFYERHVDSPTTLLEKAVKSGNIENVSYSLLKIQESYERFDLVKMLCLAMPNPPIFKFLFNKMDLYYNYNFKKYEVVSNVLENAAKENNEEIINIILKYLRRNDTELSVANKIVKLHPTEMKQIDRANPGMVITYAASCGHLNALKTLLNNHAIAKSATWCENLPLRRAQKKLNEINSQALTLTYNQIIQLLMNIPAVSRLDDEQKKVDKALVSLEKQHPLVLTSYCYLRKHTSAMQHDLSNLTLSDDENKNFSYNKKHLNTSRNDDEEASSSEEDDNFNNLVTVEYRAPMCRLM